MFLGESTVSNNGFYGYFQIVNRSKEPMSERLGVAFPYHSLVPSLIYAVLRHLILIYFILHPSVYSMSIIKVTPSVSAVGTERRRSGKALSTWPGTSQALYCRNTCDILIVRMAWYQAWTL